jgi:hypothetical protein
LPLTPTAARYAPAAVYNHAGRMEDDRQHTTDLLDYVDMWLEGSAR